MEERVRGRQKGLEDVNVLMYKEVKGEEIRRRENGNNGRMKRRIKEMEAGRKNKKLKWKKGK